MSPAAHGLISWWVANVRPLSRRDRLLVFLTGMAPDLDGLSIVAGLDAYLRWHHVVCHNLLFGLVCFALTAVLAQERRACVLLGCLSFHLHLASDYFGSGGWDGRHVHVWVLPYLYPFVGGWDGPTFVGPAWYWNPRQWPLSSLINVALSLVGLAGMIYTGVRLNRTWFEFVVPRFDEGFCQALRHWFGGQQAETWSPREARWVRRSLVVLCVVATWACVFAALHATGERLVAGP